MSKLVTIDFIKAVFQKYKVGYTDDCTGTMFDSCSGTMMGYCNTVQSQVFTKNDCPVGQTGTDVTYTVPANTYCMKPTLAEANQLALDDIAANGQNYANLNGSCNCPCSFIPTYKTAAISSLPDQLYYINDYSPLPSTYLGLPAISIDDSLLINDFMNFRIRGISQESFGFSPMTWTGVGFGNTVMSAYPPSTCNGGLVAKQSNDRLILKSEVTTPTLITATFNAPSCGGSQTISFYILP